MTMDQPFGEYRAVRSIGRGGMAAVYEGLDPDLDRRVAIKVIHPHLAADPDFEERFRREARLVASLRHPHIVQLYDYEMQDGAPVMIMEYLPGGTLADRMEALAARGERMALERIADILDALGSALDYAHSRGAVHRDIKPANILFTAEGDPVLADFGIARMVHESPRLTQSGGMVGTPAYLAPEQAAGGPLDGRCDLYALGVVLYQMITGRLPFEADSAAGLLVAHREQPPPPPRRFTPELAPEVEALLLQALAKEPGARPASGTALAAAFRAAIGQPGPPGLADLPTQVDGGPPRGDDEPTLMARAAALVDEESPSPVPRPARQLNALAGRLGVVGPLLGHEVPLAGEDRRSRAATILGIIGLLCAALQFLVDMTDLVQRAWRPLSIGARALPFAAGLLLVAGTGAALTGIVRPSGPLPRRRAATLLLGLMGGTLLWSGWTLYGADPPAAYRIVIGEFEGGDSHIYLSGAGHIYDAMLEAFAPLDEKISVERTYTAYASAAEAIADGRARNATLVVWGWYDDHAVSTHIEVIPDSSAAGLGGAFMGSGGVVGKSAADSAPAVDLSVYVRRPRSLPSPRIFSQQTPGQMTAAASVLLGTGFLARQDYESARKLLDNAIELLDEVEDDGPVGISIAYFQRSALHWSLGDLEAATADLEAAIRHDPEFFEAQFNLAIAYAAGCATQDRLQRGLEAAERAHALRPTDRDTLHLLADLQMQDERPADAVATLQLLVDQQTADALTHQLLARAHAAGQDPAAATAALENALATQSEMPASLEGHLRLGDTYMVLERYDEARQAYERAAALAPQDPAPRRGLANVHFWREEWDEAVDGYQSLLEDNPSDSDSHVMLAILAMRQGREADAEEHLVRAAEVGACDPAPHYLLAGLHYENERFREAQPAYQEALRLDPTDADLHFLLAGTHVALEEWPQAVEAFAAAIALRPDYVEALWGQATGLMALGDYAAVIPVWRAYLALESKAVDGWNRLGLAHLSLGQWPEAVEAFEEGLALEGRPDIYTNLGLAAFNLGETEQALAAFSAALEVDPQQVGAWVGQGDVYSQMGAAEEAKEAYGRALALEERADIWAGLGRAQNQMGDLPVAIAALERAMELQPDAPHLPIQTGSLYLQSGEFAEAEALFARAREANPWDPAPLFWLSIASYRQCRLSGTVQALKELTALDDGAVWMVSLATAYAARGDSQAATETIAGILASDDQDYGVHLAVGNYLLQTGAVDQAMAHFQRAAEAAQKPYFAASRIHAGIGHIHRAQKRNVAAGSEFTRALTHWPANVEIYPALGDLALLSADVEMALGIYEEGLELLPRYRAALPDQVAVDQLAAALHARRGLALEVAGRNEESALAFEQAREIGLSMVARMPNDPTSNFVLGSVYLAGGDPEGAERAFGRAVQCDQTLGYARALFEAEMEQLRGIEVEQ